MFKHNMSRTTHHAYLPLQYLENTFRKEGDLWDVDCILLKEMCVPWDSGSMKTTLLPVNHYGESRLY